MAKNLHDLSLEELKAERQRLHDSLCDLEEMHVFTFSRTSVHIGADKAQRMQHEFEQERVEVITSIEEIEKLLKEKQKT